MANWTYGGNPSASPKDAVRFYVGDTDETDPLLLDGEIEYLLGLYNGAVINASIQACEMIMAKFSRMVNEQVGGVRIDFTDKIKNMNLMKQALIQRISTTTIMPYAGGISRSDVQQNNQNADRVCPDFTRHMMQNRQVAAWISNAWLWGDQPNSNMGCGC